ncbi:MAG: 3-hydroxyacyl-CoA dehydrogenase NAD-binding domain-containing protein [Candidatus Eremiobacteraeota bacterium]|nr:3-hydroxyacyl-CoA dehydrogenase NAD-binding domain-containing protein [Candidatus Eremiobacteraeota bacterium]
MGYTHTADHGVIRVVTIDNPPVNALSFAVSAELTEIVEAAEKDGDIKAVIFTGANDLFSGGADINDFAQEPGPDTKTIRHVIAGIEKSDKTYVAAIDGLAMGGGLEVSLACDYRVATKRSKVGLPEIKLGLLPGGGGTQRLPRLIGAQAAMEMMLKGESVNADDAKKKGILDEVVDGNVVEAAIALARRGLEHEPKRRVSTRQAQLGIPGLGLNALPFIAAQAHKMVPKEENGGFAAHKLVDAVEAAVEFPFVRGIAREERLFDELVRSAPSAALRHVFFAERELAKIPGLEPAQPREIKKAGVVGGGLMGTGIAITFANAGIPVTVIEPSEAATEKGKQMVFGMYMHQVQKGRLTQEEAWKRGQSVVYSDDYNELGDADVVIEAVFESMDVKKQVFEKLDSICKPQAILASNTSTLDIDEMAAVTKRPDKVVGLHFFAPANIMKLLEIVRGKATSAQTLTTSIKLGKSLRKVAVVSANAFGFIGNRMLFDYAREAMALAEEGIAPHRIDAVMKNFGFAMGPFAMFDLSGLDVFWHIQQARPDTKGRSNIVDRMFNEKRIGQKSGQGFYKYEKGSREPIRDEEAEKMIAQEAASAGIKSRVSSDTEIVQRLVYALINAGANLLREGIALRPGDIDIVYVYGYGFPPHRGGPMWYADVIGVKNVYQGVSKFQSEFGNGWTPSPLLADIAKNGGTFASWTQSRHAAREELTHA